MCVSGRHLALPTLGAGHDEARVGQVPLAVLGAVHIGAAALLLAAVGADGGVDGNGVGALGLLGRAVALDLTALGVAELGGGGRKINQRNGQNVGWLSFRRQSVGWVGTGGLLVRSPC